MIPITLPKESFLIDEIWWKVTIDDEKWFLFHAKSSFCSLPYLTTRFPSLLPLPHVFRLFFFHFVHKLFIFVYLQNFIQVIMTSWYSNVIFSTHRTNGWQGIMREERNTNNFISWESKQLIVRNQNQFSSCFKGFLFMNSTKHSRKNLSNKTLSETA